VTTVHAPVGGLIREWRTRRRLSQLELSLAADVSTRHLSYVETGRSKPTAEMILRLAGQLEVPLRERNRLLLAGGYAPVYPERGLDDPAMAPVRRALRRLITAQQPYPALVVDRHWNLVEANSAMTVFLAGVDADLLAPPMNVLRLSLHPRGMAPRIVNHGEWRAHILARLRHQAAATGDPELHRLGAELATYPCADPAPDVELPGPGDVLVPMRYLTGHGELSLFSTTSVLGTPLDVTLAELAIEAFFPADDETAELLGRLAGCLRGN
jgi:transcriptional regulator with XRE-family HTH domain